MIALARFPGYPDQTARFEVRPGVWMNYIDAGPRDGEVIVMLHGNPSWSYLWRHLVNGLSDPALGKQYRCIVPDHIGMGLAGQKDAGNSGGER